MTRSSADPVRLYDVLPAADELTQGFGCTDLLSEWYAPWCPKRRYHSGVDLGHTLGGSHIFRAPVFATRDGIVVRVGDPVGLGDQAVCLELDSGGWLWYGHLDQADVTMGQVLQAGQRVGLLGNRGLSLAPHLHLERRIDGPTRNVDHGAVGLASPLPFLYAAGSMLEDQVIALGHMMHLLAYGTPMDGQSQADLVNTWKAGGLNFGNQFASWYGDGGNQGKAYRGPSSGAGILHTHRTGPALP